MSQHGLAFTTSAALLLGLAGPARADRLLHFSDHPDDGVAEAAAAVGLTVRSVGADGTALRNAWDRGADLLVVHVVHGHLPVEAEQVLQEAFADGVPVLLSDWGLDDRPGLLATLAIDAVDVHDPLPLRSHRRPVDLFADVGGWLHPTGLDHPDDGDVFRLRGGGWVAASSPLGDVVVVVHGGRVVVNGFLPAAYRGHDGDGDGRDDLVEVLATELAWLRSVGTPTVEARGACPGALDLRLSDLSPGAPWALVAGAGAGVATVPGGPCAGLGLGLDAPRVVARGRADRLGQDVVGLRPPAAVCGGGLQALDLQTCEASAVVRLP